MNTFETKFENKNANDPSAKDISLDMEFTQQRVTGYAEMFPDQVPLGWYSVKQPSASAVEADQPTAQDLACMQTQVSNFCENPIMMIMNPESQSAKDSKKLPFFVYQAVKTGVDGQAPAQPFVQLDTLTASEASEQIAVGDVHIAVDPNAQNSALQQRMEAPITAVKILRSKLNFLIEVVKQSPEVRANRNFMRRLNQIASSQPITATETYDSQFFGEYSDAVAMNMMMSVTQSCQELQKLVDDFQVLTKARGLQVSDQERMDMGGGFGSMGGMGGMLGMGAAGFRVGFGRRQNKPRRGF